jgi:hypothetical protein
MIDCDINLLLTFVVPIISYAHVECVNMHYFYNSIAFPYIWEFW